MRHFFVARPVAALSLGMRGAAPPAGLVARPAPERAAPGPSGAVSGAVNLAAVAAATDQRLGAASRADEQPRRRGLGMAIADTPGGRTPRLPGYWPCMRARHGVGHGVEPNRQVQISAPCLPLDTGKLSTGKPMPGQPAAVLHRRVVVSTNATLVTPAILGPPDASATSDRQTARPRISADSDRHRQGISM